MAKMHVSAIKTTVEVMASRAASIQICERTSRDEMKDFISDLQTKIDNDAKVLAEQGLRIKPAPYLLRIWIVEKLNGDRVWVYDEGEQRWLPESEVLILLAESATREIEEMLKNYVPAHLHPNLPIVVKDIDRILYELVSGRALQPQTAEDAHKEASMKRIKRIRNERS